MKVLIGIDDEKIFKKIKDNKNINVVFNNIQYKEGFLEILEKNKNINYIIISEKIYGQIKIEELVKKIKIINKKINIIIILNKSDLTKEKYLIENKIKFIYIQELSTKKILELIFNKNKLISISGNEGSGKTTITLIISEILIKYKNKKILIVEDNTKNNSISKIFNLKIKSENKKNKIIKIKNNLYLLNIKKILFNYKKDKIKIINEINKIRNDYDYIFIDLQNINSYKIYKEIIEKNLIILNPNIIEINKIKNFIINNKLKSKIILNYYNENSISEKILKNIFNNKVNIIGKIKNDQKYNLIINNKFNINYLNKKTINNFLNIIEQI